MNEPTSSRFADIRSERIASLEALELQARKQTKAAPLAWHHGNLKAAARRRLPRAIFDYIEGGSYDEVTLKANLADLAGLRLSQRVLANAASRHQRTTIVGLRASMPVALAPIGLAGLLYPQGEIYAARAAQEFGVPFCLSTLSCCSIEDVAAAVHAPFLFQLYMFKDRAINSALLQRAEQAECPALVLTLDTAVPGRRNRDLDNGLVVPLRVRARHVVGILTRLRWTFGWLSSKRTLGNLAMFVPGSSKLADVSAWAERHYKGAVGKVDVEWVREQWPGKLIIKGILDPNDARDAVNLGADAIIVSNHGGRQLDGADTPVKAFPAIRDAVGSDVELIFDGGVRSGLDVLKALGLGAKACLIGRAYAYGLAAYGEAGVTTALQLIEQELDTAMALTGVNDVAALPQGLVIGPVRT
jgi:L-lactate dehydrogenase (cytochrome)